MKVRVIGVLIEYNGDAPAGTQTSGGGGGVEMVISWQTPKKFHVGVVLKYHQVVLFAMKYFQTGKCRLKYDGPICLSDYPATGL